MRRVSVGCAVRYQWTTAAAVLLCAVLSSQFAKSSIIARIPSSCSRTIAETIQPLLPIAWASVLLIRPVHSNAGLKMASADPLFSPRFSEGAKALSFAQRPIDNSELIHWRARRQYLETQIADAKEMLASMPDGEGLTVTISAKPLVRVAPSSRNISAEETSLRKQVNERKAHLDLLRTSDTDLHPDVIEAREALTKAQGEFDAVQRLAEAAMPTALPLPAPLQQTVVETAGVSSQRFETMQQVSNLIHAKARVDDQIKEAEASLNSVPEYTSAIGLTDAYKPLPLGGVSAITAVNSEHAPIELSLIAKTAGYELCCTAISLALALVTACFIESWQDHIPKVDALLLMLPVSVTFLGSVPRMRKS